MKVTTDNYDEALRKGLIDYKLLELSHVPPENEINHVFSEKYLKAKARLLRKLKKQHLKHTNTVVKRVAVIIACCFIAATSALSVEAVRNKIVEFFYNVFDTHTEIVSDDSEKRTTVETYYTLAYIPEGYTVDIEDVNSNGVYFTAKNNNSQQISFEQALSYDSLLSFDSENTDVIETIINKTPCIMIKQNFDYIFYWEFDGYGFTLTYPDDLGENFAEEVIGKLVKVEK